MINSCHRIFCTFLPQIFSRIQFSKLDKSIKTSRLTFFRSGFCPLLSDDDNPVEKQPEQGSKGGILYSEAYTASPKEVS